MKQKKIRNKILVFMLSFACLISSGFSVQAQEGEMNAQTWKQETKAGEAEAGEEIIKILTADDLLLLAKHCSLDEWSVGKTVLLENDIDLTDSGFTSIPIFGGTFDGQGHTVSGFSIQSSGDIRGFFRYVQKDGVVKNLTVEGNIAPDGHKDTIGGIVGNNSGKLTGCIFKGSIKGENQIGGIAGINEADGQLINCSFEGEVTGEHYVGGIAGQNLGSIIRCSNSGSINTTEVKTSVELSDIDLEKSLGQINSVENVPACTDIGGIAGASGGILQSCENFGDVGYEHMGYNVGGIAGRQSGYLDGCVNEGLVQGRKDVGGIAGQFEPEMVLIYNSDTLNELWDELEVLQKLLDTTIKDAKGVSGSISESMQSLSNSVENMQNATGDLTDSLIGWADENMEKINDFSARISWTMDQMEPVADSFGNAIELMKDAGEQLTRAIEEEKLGDQLDEETTGEILDAMNDFYAAATYADDAAKQMNESSGLLEDAIGDPEEMQSALEKMADGCEELGDAFVQMSKAQVQIGEALKGNEGFEELEGTLAQSQNASDEFGEALKQLEEALRKIQPGEDDPEGIEQLLYAAEAVNNTGQQLKTTGRAVAAALTLSEQDNIVAAEEAYGHLVEEQGELEQAFYDLETLMESGDQSTKTSSVEFQDDLQMLLEKAGSLSTAYDTLESVLDTDASAIKDEIADGRELLDQLEKTAKDLLQSAAEKGRYFAQEFTLETVIEEDSATSSEEEPAIEENPDTSSEEDDASPDVDDSAEEPSSGEENDTNPPKTEFEQEASKWKDAAKELSDTINSLHNSIESIEELLDKLQEAGALDAETVDVLSGFSATMKESYKELANGSSGIRKTLSELADEPAIQFTPLNARVTQQKDALQAALGDMTGRMDDLNNTMTVSSDVLLSDMEAINRQFGVIIDLLRKSSEEEVTGIEEQFEDISDESEEQEVGRVSGSFNSGVIQGDINVAGIVGTMAIEYDFDPENDLVKYGNTSLDFTWLTSAVLTDCINTGEVTAKKNYAGGIVGLMDLGKVSGCESYGAVTSSGGSYVGGIAGVSYAIIRDSWAKCSLSGTDYIGGIAGYGATITGCRSLIEVEEGSACLGTIAGMLEEDGTIEGNVYVHDTLAAVDNISYAGKAEPVSFDEMLSDSIVPEKFKQFELTFTADGKVVEVVPFQYGKGITKLPEIPAKDGYIAKWPDIDYSYLTFGRTLEAEYVPYESALASEGEIPQILVDGSFSNEAVIEHTAEEMTIVDEAGKEHTGTLISVKVEDPVLEGISYTVHYRLPDAGKKYRLWLMTENGWVKTAYDTDGTYLLLEHDGEKVTFLIEEYSTIWIAVTIAAAVAILLILLFVVKKSGKKKR